MGVANGFSKLRARDKVTEGHQIITASYSRCKHSMVVVPEAFGLAQADLL